MRVEASGLRKRFGRVEALRGVDLGLPSGRRTALIGPNGSGKSTLIRAVAGLISFDGRVLVDGCVPGDLAILRRMAYVPQVAPQLAAPVGDLVAAIASVRGLDPADVAAVATRLDLDLAAIRRRAFRDLSGGMKQKLLIALALASRVELLVLDEPTASLDANARETFFRLYEELAPEATLILCSHRLEEIRHLVDHVVTLQDGLVKYDGASDAWLAAREVSTLELRVRINGYAPALLGLGFLASRDGWWSRTGNRRENAALLPALSGRLGADLEDVLVRHAEKVEVT